MTELTYSIERDLKEAELMAGSLIPYVYEDILYGKISSGFFSGSMPSLTIGALLLRLRRLHTLSGQMTPEQQTRLAEAERRHEQVAREWQQNYRGKLLKEALSRLDNLRAYFEESRENPQASANAFNPEALRRTIIQEIADVLDNRDLDMKIKQADSHLQRIVQRGDFMWDELLQPVYPPEVFWWLYSKPPRREEKKSLFSA